MHTRQLPSSGNRVSGHPTYGGPVTYVYQPIAPTNTLAIVGMVLSLIGAITSFIPAGIAGLIMGHISRRQIRRQGERGDAMALTALWVGYLGTGFWVLVWALYIGFMIFMIMLGVIFEEAAG